MINKYKSNASRGFALFEALIALAITAIGLLAIIGVQLRTIADTQTTSKRAQAIELINQFSEVLKSSPSSINNASSYSAAFGINVGNQNADDTTTCVASVCTAAQKATRDRNQWIKNVRRVMPLGDAAIFVPSDQTVATDIRQLGVLISWRRNEKTDAQGNVDSDYEDQFNISTSAGVPACPTGRICHLQFVPLTSRCSPSSASGTVQFFCPDPKTKF